MQSLTNRTQKHQLIEVCGSYFREQILQDVRIAKYYSVIADEATDASNCEQLSVVLRFVDKGFNVREEFLGFVSCTSGVSGEAFVKYLVDLLENKWCLNLGKSLWAGIQRCWGNGWKDQCE